MRIEPLDCDCLLRASQQARLPLNCTCGTFPVFRTVWMIGIWRCITTGTLTIRSMKRFEKRSWGMIWTTPAISSTTCGSGTWTICSKCATKRAHVGSIAQLQRSRPRLAERTHSSPASQQARLPLNQELQHDVILTMIILLVSSRYSRVHGP